MRRTFIVLALFILGTIGAAWPVRNAAQSAGPSPTPVPRADAFETVKEFLLTSAANDFHEHQPPYPAEFRNVRIGHVGEKELSYRLCGEFLPADAGYKGDWVGFVTIKTSGYEQYIGSGLTYCTDSKIIWDTTDDLASTLKSRLDSIKKKKQ